MATFGSLFAGVGGFDIGFEAAGWKCEFQVEWDKHCQQTLQHHWPDVPKWWDVSDVKGTELPPVDLITFGSPCQDLSVAGNRAGLQLEGGRSNLFYEATRIIKEMRDGTGNNFPRWAIWENVPGAFSSNKGADFGSVLDEMANIGAVAVEWNCLDAQFFGVPQRRRRVFVIACFDPAIANRGGQKILPVSEGRRRNTSTRKPKGQSVTGETPTSVGTDSELGSGQTVANTISASLYHHGTVVNQDANNGHVVIERPTIVGSLQARDYKGVGNQYVMENKLVVQQTLCVPIQDGREMEKKQNGLGVGGEGDPAYTLDQTGAQAVAYSIREDATANTFSATEIETARSLSAVRPSVQSHHAQTFITQVEEQLSIPTMQVRRLTPIECERLMGWPDNHTLHRADGGVNSDTSRYKMCGNGVASPVAQWIAEQILPIHEAL